MRIFAYIVAVLSLASCLGCLIAIPKFHAVYEDLGIALPFLTRFLINYGVLLSALFLLLAVTLIVLASVNKPGIAAGLAGVTLLLLLISGVLVPVALMMPMATAVESLDDGGMGEVTPEAP